MKLLRATQQGFFSEIWDKCNLNSECSFNKNGDIFVLEVWGKRTAGGGQDSDTRKVKSQCQFKEIKNLLQSLKRQDINVYKQNI